MTTCKQPSHLFIKAQDGDIYCATCGEGPIPVKHQKMVDWTRALEARFGREPWNVPEAEIVAFRAEWERGAWVEP